MWKLSLAKLSPKNIHLLRKGKHEGAADLQFDWFGFDQTCQFNIIKAAEFKLVNKEVSCTAILPPGTLT